MVAERVLRCFWPLWTVLGFGLTPLVFGWQDLVPLEIVWVFVVLFVIALGGAIWWGVRRFRLPSDAEALAAVDANLKGRPIAALADSQAVGSGDADSEAVWQAHMVRMEARTHEAAAIAPDLHIAKRDPFGLRFIALLCLVVALLFGSLWRVSSVATMAPGATGQLATGPVWEGWIEPPTYTGKPALYLNDIKPGALSVPKGSALTLRLYGEVGALTVAETISGRSGVVEGSASDAEQEFDITQSGELRIDGADGVKWDITVLADVAPNVSVLEPVSADATGEMSQPFAAQDDYAVVAGNATVVLNLPEVSRKFGLTRAPEPFEPLILDLPVPFSGDRADFDEVLVDNLSEHPLANLPVTVVFQVEDASGQTGETEAFEMVLPGRRFFQPIAKAIVEQRQYLMWSKDNVPQITQVLKAISHRPEGFFRSDTTYLRLRFTVRRMDVMVKDGFSEQEQTEIVDALWELAILLEDGTLADARKRLQRAQERLAEAMRNGASEEEIAELMDELRDATDDYMQMLADQMEPAEDGTDQPDQAQDSMDVSRDELQALMDEIERLMQEGKMAEAEALMEQLNQLMENLQMTQGEEGNGPQTPGQQSMEDLGETLRDQQELSDESFEDLQDQFNQNSQDQQGDSQGQQPGQPGEEGQDGQEGTGLGQGGDPQDGQQSGQGGGGEQSLADRQEALRRELERQREALPNMGGEAGEEARGALDRAGEAMREAERALEEGNLAEAIDKQAEAMNALREGIRNMGQALAQDEQDRQGQGEQAGQAQNETQQNRRDPLGREAGNSGQLGTDDDMLQGSDVYRRADELLQELRRRSADQTRPEDERNYLRRLLDRF